MVRQREERRRASARRRVDTHQTGGGSKYVNLPEGYSFLQVKPGKYRLDFMSYVVTKGKGQTGGNPYFEKGELAFERTFFVHRDVGPNQEWHLCAAKTFGQPCPICEFRAKQARDPNADEDTLKELAPKERQLWIVKDLSDPDQLHVLEFSYHLFGKQLDAKIRSGDEEDGYEFFADPVEGLSVRVNFEQSDRGKWVEATDIEFRPRKEQYDADVVEEQPDLDACLVATPYDKLKKIFLQTDEGDADDDDDDDDEKPKAKSKAKGKKATATADEFGLEEGDQVEYNGDLCEIVRISKDGTSLTLENEDGEQIRAVGADEVKKPKSKKPAKKKPAAEEEDDDEIPFDDEKPAKKKPAKKKPAKDEDDDDDWDDEEEEEEEEPAPKARRGKAKSVKDDDDDDDDDDDEEPAPKRGKAPAKGKAAKSKPAAGKKKGSKADDDDDDWDDWDE